MPPALDAFTRGDYLSAARHLPPDTWQYWATLGLIGHPADASAALQQFPDAEAVFYSGVAAWIAGEDDGAVHILEGCEGEHARRLRESDP